MAARTDAEAIQDVMAARSRLETAARIARIRAEDRPDIAAEIDVILQAAATIKARLSAWHLRACRRMRS